MTLLCKTFFSSFPTLLLCITTISVMATSTGSIKGKVIAEHTGEALPFVNIFLEVDEKTQGAQTDLDGRYLIDNIPAGKYEISASYIGYENSTKEVRVEAGKTVELDFKLTTGSLLLETVIAGSGTKKGKRKKGKMRGPRGPARTTGETGPAVPNRAATRIDAISVPKGYNSQAKHREQNTAEPFNREGYDEIKENKFFNVKNEPLSTFSIDVDAASYANVRRMINQGQKPLESAVRIEEMINYFNYDYPEPQNTDPFNVITELAQCPWNNKHQLLHIGLQGKKIHASNLPPSNIVLLIDASGSMGPPNKLPLVKKSFKLLVNELRPQDKLSIVTYAGAGGVVLPPTSGSDKETIIQALESITSGGSTAGSAGIDVAYKVALENYVQDGNNRVILATDGDFNVGISSDGELVKLIEQKVLVWVIIKMLRCKNWQTMETVIIPILTILLKLKKY